MVVRESALESLLSVVNRFDLKSLRLQVLSYQAAKLYVIVDHKYAIHAFLLSLLYIRILGIPVNNCQTGSPPALQIFTAVDRLFTDRKSTRLNSSHVSESRMP